MSNLSIICWFFSGWKTTIPHPNKQRNPPYCKTFHKFLIFGCLGCHWEIPLFFWKFGNFPKFWGNPKFVPQISPNFPKFPQIQCGRSLLRLRDFGARLRIVFYASEKLFLACFEYVPWAQLHKKYTTSDFGNHKIIVEIPKIWGNPQFLGKSPNFGEIPKFWGFPFWGFPQIIGDFPKFGDFLKFWGFPQILGNVRNL